MPIATINIGTQISNRLTMLCCSTCRKSATIKRAERKAVSPEVIGAAMTPKTANRPPTTPNHSFVIASTMTAALLSDMPCS